MINFIFLVPSRLEQIIREVVKFGGGLHMIRFRSIDREDLFCDRSNVTFRGQFQYSFSNPWSGIPWPSKQR